MSEQTAQPVEAQSTRGPGYLATATTAWVALAYCLVVVGLLVANAIVARSHEPLAPAEIEVLRAELGADPANEEIRTQIRSLDHQIRKTYFVTRDRALHGTYLLGIGVAVFLLASHLAGKFRAKALLPNPEAEGRSWVDAALGLKSVTALGLAMTGFMLAMLIFARHDTSAEYIREAQEMAESDVAVQVAEVPDPPPGAVSLPGATAADGLAGLPPPPGGGTAPGFAAPAPAPVGKPGPGFAPAPATNDPPAEPDPPGETPTPGPTPTPANPGPGFGGPTPPAPKITVPDGWPMFRGPVAGLAAEADFLTEWDAEAGTGILWTTEIPLPGHNSPVFANGRLFLTAADKEQRKVYGIDAKTGDIAWERDFERDPAEGEELPKVMEDTGYAAPTMATDGELVFAMFANGDIVAYDLEGEIEWALPLGVPKNQYGHASSLAIHEDRLIVQYDQDTDPDANLSALIALDTKTGDELWFTERPVPNSWSSPIVVKVGEQVQIVTSADPWVIAYEPEKGKELWRTECNMADVGPSPCYADGIVYAVSNLGGLFAIRASDTDAGKAGEVVWESDENLPDTASPACNGDILLTASSYGMVMCYDAKQGTKLWEQDFSTMFQSSPVIVGKHAYLGDNDGVTHIFEAARTYKAVSQAKVPEPIRATPAFIEGRIYLRSDNHLYCIGAEETEG